MTRALIPGGMLIILDSPVAPQGWRTGGPAGGVTRGNRVFSRDELDAALHAAGLTPEWITVSRGRLWAQHRLKNWLRRRPRFDFPLIVARKASESEARR